MVYIDLMDEEIKCVKFFVGLFDDREKLFDIEFIWDWLLEVKVEGDYRILFDKGIVESLGEFVFDMV